MCVQRQIRSATSGVKSRRENMRFTLALAQLELWRHGRVGNASDLELARERGDELLIHANTSELAENR
jgi:hypothetical protein